MTRLTPTRLLLALVLASSLGAPRSAGAAAPAGRPEQPGPQHHFAITRGAAEGLPDHTLLRPADLSQVHYRMPIVTWANGGCRNSNMEFNFFLTHLAAYGYFVVANGEPAAAYDPAEVTGMVKPAPDKLKAAISWAITQDADPTSRYYRRLDTHRVIAMGQSCGGYEALDASASDARISTTIIWDSGDDPQDPTAVGRLHAPVLYADGGTTDVMDWDATASYHATGAPVVLASLANAGHSGMWDDPAPPAAPPGQFQAEPLVVAQQWIMFTLFPSQTSSGFFLGPGCGLCRRPGWSVQSKNWRQSPTP